jgi:hypothetical protein
MTSTPKVRNKKFLVVPSGARTLRSASDALSAGRNARASGDEAVSARGSAHRRKP